MKKQFLLASTLWPMLAVAGHDLPIEIVEVVGEKTNEIVSIEMHSKTPLTSPVYDAGALLRSINGMDAARRGGRGFDPIIRGQSQNQINVIIDGAYNFGAGPNRMDPPSTYVGFDSFDKVTVIKGNRSVIYGAGGSGGTLLFEHQRPDFSDKRLQGKITAGHTTNSDIDNIAADFALGNEQVFIRVFGERKSSGHYEDGDGNTVSAAFDSEIAGIITGADISENNYLEASYEQANEKDAFYAGNGMDAPYADSETARLRWLHNGPLGFLDTLDVNIYRSDVKHLMDNYTLRNRNMMMNGMAAPTASDTWGGRILGTIETKQSQIKLGVDYLANDRRAQLFMDMGKDGSLDMLSSLMWPDIEQRQLGIFTEWDYQVDMKDTLRLALRYDQFESEATNADTSVGMMGVATPTTLYQTYYGTDETKTTSNNFGMVLGWDRALQNSMLISVNLSRSVRNPDANENFMARSVTMNNMPSQWIGNPDIESEKHHQADITLMSEQAYLDWSATIFWNEVDDYIERYQDGTATLYRNIHASLRGAELELSKTITDSMNGRAAVSYTRGEGDNGDLAKIAPLTGKFSLDYRRETWAIGSEIIVADRQTNFDEDVDVNDESPGFTIMNLYSHWKAIENLTLEAGIENLLNKAYAYHVNTASVDPFDPTAIRVNEPGRQYWVRIRYEL